MKYHVIIVGAGAAGLVAACNLARSNRQLNILVIEKEKLPGRKLNATGNGKCNLTNSKMGAQYYYSQNRECVDFFFEQHQHTEVLDFFSQVGILLWEKDGYYYPISNQAKQVTELLYTRCKEVGVKFLFDTEVMCIEPDEKYTYKVFADTLQKKNISFYTSNVILCTGGLAAPQLGGTKSGYLLAKHLHIPQIKTTPVLTPAHIVDKDLRIAKGVRLDTVITLRVDGQLIAREEGQLQINEDNLSGIAMMNLSCIFNLFPDEIRKDCLHIDVLPMLNWEQVKEYIQAQCLMVPDESVFLMLQGLFPAKFASFLLKKTGIPECHRIGMLTQKQCNKIASFIKKWTVTPCRLEDFGKAQVTAGGVCLENINMQTFEEKQHSGLYIAGEILDIHGKCGGYNLTFAVLSGLCASEHILKNRIDNDRRYKND